MVASVNILYSKQKDIVTPVQTLGAIDPSSVTAANAVDVQAQAGFPPLGLYISSVGAELTLLIETEDFDGNKVVWVLAGNTTAPTDLFIPVGIYFVTKVTDGDGAALAADALADVRFIVLG